ncbi:PTB domain-containing adapter protein ced-6 isoform X2 [Pararge aegeria]|nr:PTB domain-containing adapter protein ced-6 isoform X2 [Pararge aegeria]XP_039747742.1 PTB domain-containing adapter protein ced-6 isoform X2 [Pararge aegeria]XP_039747743.1 PTB domain-containing adapter protein ced-6 isoform X2 [Pararge aegeria]XP_039747744.1 PTB domain-containing adapter protein ced-6 isoform X2 [Pararge aegeria]
MSTLLFWQGKGKANGSPNARNWIHAPDALIKGHVAYLVKFLGCTQVDQPKGIEVVKDAIKKLQFTQQLKKSETKDAAKCKKVEITVSVDGVAIQEPRSNNVMYQFPLHRISYCADDKGAKKYFSFIAKGGSTVNGVNGHDGSASTEKHECFVFISTKLASEITLTIGQAFDLAYRRFLNDNGKYIEMQKLTLQNKRLELQMNTYKNRLQELSKITYKDDLTAYLARNSLTDIAEFKPPLELEKQISSLTLSNGFSAMNGTKTPDIGADALSNNSTDTFNSSNDNNLLLSTPPPTHNGKTSQSASKFLGDLSSSKNPTVGTRLENLLLNSDSDSDFDPRAFESEPVTRFTSPVVDNSLALASTPPLLAPPPKASKRQTQPQPQPQHQPPQPPTHTPIAPLNGNDLFGSTPFSLPNQNQQMQNTSPFAPQNKPNYDIKDFNLQTSVFNTTSFTNGLTGYDPFETQKAGNFIANGYGNTFNGFGNLSEKQTVELDSGFNGFLDKTITEMKDGFSRGISFGNDDFSIDNLDPFKKN